MSQYKFTIDSDFRNTVDLLFFSNRMDLDLNSLSKVSNSNEYANYFIDRFEKGIQIYWENPNELWYYRFKSVFETKHQSLVKRITHLVEYKFYLLFKTTMWQCELTNEYIQFLQFCKVKSENNLSLSNIKGYFGEISNHIDIDRTIKIIQQFSPYVFKDMDDYIQFILKKVIHSTRNLSLLDELSNRGFKYDNKSLVELTNNIILTRAPNNKNRRALFALLKRKKILSEIKKLYTSTYKKKLIDIVENADFREIEEDHLINIQNLLYLDASLIEKIEVLYADKLYDRNTGHKRANVDRLIRLSNNIPQASSKRIIHYLLSNKKMNDVKYFVKAFPHLESLAVFA